MVKIVWINGELLVLFLKKSVKR